MGILPNEGLHGHYATLERQDSGMMRGKQHKRCIQNQDEKMNHSDMSEQQDMILHGIKERFLRLIGDHIAEK